MPSRAAASIRSPTMNAATDASSPARLRRISRWISARAGMAWLHRGVDRHPADRLLRDRGLAEEHVEWRHVRVPLDQRRPRTETRESLSVERPHGFANPRAVIVDAKRSTVREPVYRVACEVKLT